MSIAVEKNQSVGDSWQTWKTYLDKKTLSDIDKIGNGSGNHKAMDVDGIEEQVKIVIQGS